MEKEQRMPDEQHVAPEEVERGIMRGLVLRRLVDILRKEGLDGNFIEMALSTGMIGRVYRKRKQSYFEAMIQAALKSGMGENSERREGV